MKLKQLPDDFFVEELTDAQPAADGDFAFYRLEKRGWTTPDALQAIRRRWKLDLQRISFGGLKDRHAHTVQYLTIWRGPQRRLHHQGIQLEFLGRRREPYTSADFRGNRFRLVLRSLSAADVEVAAQSLEEVRQGGVPNYFDDQRFGSAGGGEFVAKALVLGDFEQALRLAVAAPYEHDRAPQKRTKALLRSHWGDWALCQRTLPPGHARNLVTHLVRNPGDFRGAVSRLHPELRGLYMSAYQSHLWNRMLAKWLQARVPQEHLLPMELCLVRLPMHHHLPPETQAELAALELPLPTARGEADPADPHTTLMETVLAEEGLTRQQLKVKGLREVFFSRGQRAALCLPMSMHWQAEDDDKNADCHKLVLGFELPRGSYATLIVKRAFSV